jgi:hypothetical protein
METTVQDAIAEADRLYAEYAKLSELGLLGASAPDSKEGGIVASVSPALLEGYANAIVGRTA